MTTSNDDKVKEFDKAYSQLPGFCRVIDGRDAAQTARWLAEVLAGKFNPNSIKDK